MFGPRHSTPNQAEAASPLSPDVTSIPSVPAASLAALRMAGPHMSLFNTMAVPQMMPAAAMGGMSWGTGSVAGMVPLMVPLAHLQALQSQIAAAAAAGQDPLQLTGDQSENPASPLSPGEHGEHRHRHKHKRKHSREERHKSSRHRHHDDKKRSHRKHGEDRERRHKRSRHSSPSSSEHRHHKYHKRHHSAMLLEDGQPEYESDRMGSEVYSERSQSGALLLEDRASDFDDDVNVRGEDVSVRGSDRAILMEDGEIEQRAVLMEDGEIEEGAILMEDGEIADDAEEGEVHDEAVEEVDTYAYKERRSRGYRDEEWRRRELKEQMRLSRHGRSKLEMEERASGSYRGKSGAILREDRSDRPILLDDRDNRPVLREDYRKGAVLRDDRPILREDRSDRPILIEDRAFVRGGDRGSRPVLRDDRFDRPILREDRPVLREDRIDRPIMREDRIEKRPMLREDRPILKEDRLDRPVLIEDGKMIPVPREDRGERPILREDRKDKPVIRDDRDEKPVLKEDVETSNRTGALLLEDSEIIVEDKSFDARYYANTESATNRKRNSMSGRGRGRGFDRGRGGRGRDSTVVGSSDVSTGRTGALLLEDRQMDRNLKRGPRVPVPPMFEDNRRGLKGSQSTVMLGWQGEQDPNWNLHRSASTQSFARHSRERSVGDNSSVRSRSLNRQDMRGAPDRRSCSTWEPEPDDISVAQCIRSVASKFEEVDMDPIAAWVRCSAADLYFQKDPKTGNMTTTKRMRDLEDKFEEELVQRAAKVKATQKPHQRVQQRPNWKDACKGHGTCCGSDHSSHGSSSSSSESSDSESDSEEWWMDELKFKQQNPYRLHSEIWYNEPNELNYGPLCRCSIKSRKSGIRHNIYPGEKPVPLCDMTSNNLDKLYHYRITVSPVKNFIINKPTVVMFDGHEYFFEGFSIFSHTPIPKLPDCKVIRFNIMYTIHIVEEQVPENFSVRSLDLVTKFLFDEILELVDMDWKGPGDDTNCRRFHVMPRFARPFPENGKELLSMNDVILYLLKASKPLIDHADLRKMYQLDPENWTRFVDTFRHMVVTCPGKKPSSIRIDQLDRDECVTATGEYRLPLIVHHGMRPPQLSYAGDPMYKKKWREYMKYRHLMWTRAKIGQKEKDKLDDLEMELEKIRMKCTMKREFTAAVSSEGFLKTGIRADICQHAMMLPLLFEHVRFHECLNELERTMNYTFKDRSLLQLALTHCSYKVNYGTNPDHGRNSLSNCGFRQLEFGDHKVLTQHTRKRGLNVLMRIMSKMGCKQEVRSEIPHNERLEYLGDAVVEFVTSTHLFNMFPQASEGDLTLYRGCLVQNAHLSILADKLRLQDYLLYAHGPDLCHDSNLKHAMANCFEALMGALFLEGGIEVADKVFSQTLFHEEDLYDTWVNTPKDPLVQAEPNGDRHWIQQSHILQDLVKFEEDIGYQFRHIRLLAKAFTQRNVGYNNLTFGHNQRLEFLGDTVIQLITSEFLFKHFPDHHEGHLTLLRSSLVNNKTQSIVSSELGMPDHVIKSSSRSAPEEERKQMRVKEKADLLEAVLGALYVDGSLPPCYALVETCFFPRLKEFILDQEWNDPKSQLQQCCLTLRDVKDENPDIPVYKVLQCLGPTNFRKYTVAVYFRGKRLAIGKGGSIQQAEMAAATEALNTSQDLFPMRFYVKPRNQQYTPSNQQNMPRNQQNSPRKQQYTPSGQQNTAGNQQNLPRKQQYTPSGQQNTPRNQQNSPQKQVDTPTNMTQIDIKQEPI